VDDLNRIAESGNEPTANTTPEKIIARYDSEAMGQNPIVTPQLNPLAGQYQSRARKTGPAKNIAISYQHHHMGLELGRNFETSIIDLSRVSNSVVWINPYLQSGTSLSAPTIANHVALINSSFIFRNQDRIFEFIKYQLDLLTLLVEARSKLIKYFRVAQFILEVIADPDEPDDTQLVMFVRTGLSPEEALTALAHFDEEWWADALPRAKNKLTIHLELV
jgi:hypothetical protein